MSDAVFEQKIQPPKLIPSLVEGFNAIANHIYIILFPILFDLVLWFGPMIRIKDLLLPAILNASDLSAASYGQEGKSMLETTRHMWTELLNQFNLFYSLRTYPVGVPSLLIGRPVDGNPLGKTPILEMQSSNNALWIILGLTAAGVILGSLYFSLIAGATKASGTAFNFSQFGNQMLQTFALSLILIAALMILAIPGVCLISSLVLFLPSLGDLPILLFGFVMVWVLLPLAFSPHGIFASQLKATTSIANSIKLVRALMSITGLFFIILILLGYGLDILWATPKANSWMLLVGIIGHAFISSGLIAASFSFYKNGVQWLQAILREMTTSKQKIIS
jgi:hypothetical protein